MLTDCFETLSLGYSIFVGRRCLRRDDAKWSAGGEGRVPVQGSRTQAEIIYNIEDNHKNLCVLKCFWPMLYAAFFCIVAPGYWRPVPRHSVWNSFPSWNYWARICKRLKSPGIVSKEAWRTDTSNKVVVPARQAGNRFLGSKKGLRIRDLYTSACPPQKNST